MTRFALTINGHDCIVDVAADMRLLEVLQFGAAIANAVAAACGVRRRSQPIRDLGQGGS